MTGPGDPAAQVIVVIDDEPVITHALIRLLTRPGRRVVEQHDPIEALGFIEREPVDLVITDKDLPGISGHELIDLLKDSHPDVPCIMLTGTPSLDSALLAINREQVVRYLTKPWSPHELEETVEAGLARRAVLRQAGRDEAEVTRPRGMAIPAAPDEWDDEIDRYRVIGQLGEGGMGTVYRAIHRELDRPVAIKILRDAGARDPVSRARFVREARAATRAHHPRIVETLDFGHLPDGRPYLVMELVEAPTLDVRLRAGPIEPLAAVLIGRGIAEALVAAHAAGVVHRDLKPGNVFVDAELEVKLGDFGAARLLDPAGVPELTHRGTTIGTPHYMSPEQIVGHAVDGRADLYALGCVMYRMLTNTTPYHGDDVRAVLGQHLHAPIPVPTSPSGPLPAGLVQTIHRAMAKDPTERQQTAAQLVSDLEHAAALIARGRG